MLYFKYIGCWLKMRACLVYSEFNVLFPVCGLCITRGSRGGMQEGESEKWEDAVAGWPMGGTMKTCLDCTARFCTCVCVYHLLVEPDRYKIFKAHTDI